MNGSIRFCHRSDTKKIRKKYNLTSRTIRHLATVRYTDTESFFSVTYSKLSGLCARIFMISVNTTFGIPILQFPLEDFGGYLTRDPPLRGPAGPGVPRFP